MAEQDFDISKLSDEQLAVYRELLHQKEFAKQAKEMPGPAALSLPPGINTPNVTRGLSGLPISYTAGKGNPSLSTPDKNVLNSTSEGGFFSKPENADSDLSALGQGAMAGASTAIPGPAWMKLLNAGTVRTPADLGTAAALNTVLPGLNKLKATTRTGNTTLGVAKGLGLYEGGNRLHALLNGDEQPNFSLTDIEHPWNTAFGLASSGLGAAQGYSEVPPGQSPLELARQKYDSYQQQQRALTTQINKTQAEVRAAANSEADASKRLNDHETLLDAKAQDTAKGQRRSFQTQQAALRAEAKDLGFQLANAKMTTAKLAKEAATHESSMEGRQNFGRALTAENLTDEILKHQKILDQLRNPDTADSIRAVSPQEQTLQAEIKRLNGILDSGKLNAGGEAQVQTALERNQNQLDDLADSSTRGGIDYTKNKLRELKEMRRRVNQGRVDEVPTEADLADARKLIDLRNSHGEAAANLEQLNQKYQAKVMEQLTHAKNSPGATNTDVQDLLTHKSLKDAAEQALEAKRAAAAKIDQIRIAKGELAEQNPGRPKKGDEIMDAVLQRVKQIAPAGLGLLGGHITGNLTHVGPVLDIGTSLATHGLARTDAGKKLLDFLNTRVSPNASKVIPSLVNQNATSK